MESINSIKKISSRILRVDLAGNPATTIFSIYSPTNMSSDAIAEQFYDQLSDAIDRTPLHNILLVCGDLNAKNGPDTA